MCPISIVKRPRIQAPVQWRRYRVCHLGEPFSLVVPRKYIKNRFSVLCTTAAGQSVRRLPAGAYPILPERRRCRSLVRPTRGRSFEVLDGFVGNSMISRSGTRKSSDANVLAVKQGFDFAQRSAGFSEVFRLPLRKMWVTTRVESSWLSDCATTWQSVADTKLRIFAAADLVHERSFPLLPTTNRDGLWGMTSDPSSIWIARCGGSAGQSGAIRRARTAAAAARTHSCSAVNGSTFARAKDLFVSFGQRNHGPAA